MVFLDEIVVLWCKGRCVSSSRADRSRTPLKSSRLISSTLIHCMDVFFPFSSAFYFWFYCLLSDVAWYFYVVYVFGLVIVQYLVVLILKGCSFFICSCCKIFELCWWYLNANLNSVYPCIPKFYVFLYRKWISEGSLVCRWALTGGFEGFVV